MSGPLCTYSDTGGTPDTGLEQPLRIVKTYTYLDVVLADRAGMSREVARRGTALSAVYGAISANLLSDNNLPRISRMTVATAVLDARMFAGAAVWPKLPRRMLRTLEAKRTKAFRRVASCPAGPGSETDAKVRSKVGALDVCAVLRVARLRYFGRMAAPTAPPILTSLLQCRRTKSSWIAMILEDLTALAAHMPVLLGPSPRRARNQRRGRPTRADSRGSGGPRSPGTTHGSEPAPLRNHRLKTWARNPPWLRTSLAKIVGFLLRQAPRLRLTGRSCTVTARGPVSFSRRVNAQSSTRSVGPGHGRYDTSYARRAAPAWLWQEGFQN